MLCIGCGVPKKSNTQLNIIYILADDLGYGDLSCYGQDRFSTPNIDALARQGKVFSQHYAGSTVCSPSRATLITGLHTGHSPVRGNIGLNNGQFPLPDTLPTLPKSLQKAGYITGVFGKWGLGYPGSVGEPLNQGFDEFFGFNSQTWAHNYYPPELWDNDKMFDIPENAGTERGVYAPNLIHEKTLDFIKRHKDSSFFLYIPTIIPHAEMFAPEEYMDQFTEKAPEKNFTSVSRFAPETPYEGVDSAEHPRYKKGAYGSQAQPRAAFAAMVTLLDDQVGEIIGKVKELGLEENTIIIFTSDNGPHKEGGADPEYFESNGPFRGHKRDLYEGGIRVPMIVKWPGRVNPGTWSDHVSAAWDVFSTLCDVAGIDKPDSIDGISFYPELTGGLQKDRHKYLYWEFYEQGKKQAVRYYNWKGIRTGLDSDPNAPVELYDLSSDPEEQVNLAKQFPDTVKHIRAFMNEAHIEDPQWPFFTEQLNSN